MNIVLLETVSNQPFLFSSNKLREVVGASEMILRVGTRFFLEAVDQIRSEHSRALGVDAPGALGSLWDQSNELGPALTGQDGRALNPPIEDEGSTVEVIVAASGKSLAIVRSPEMGRRLVRLVTLRAAKEAPGVAIHGAVSADFEFEQTPVHEQVQDAFRKHLAARGQLPSVDARFARLPVVASCTTSGLPAAVYDTEVPKGQRGQARSFVTMKKRGLGREEVARDRASRLGCTRLACNLEELENEYEWFGVVHADGNGFGRMFQEFHEYAQVKEASQYRCYLKRLRDFSLQLDHCTQEAFRRAVNWYAQEREVSCEEPIRLVPLVVAGDDLTVVCDGTLAAAFAERFLREFEELSRDAERFPMLVKIGTQAFGRPGLAACAGVAVVKPHFPFYAAYDLAEQLAEHAKQVKDKVYRKEPQDTACSALDVYVHTMSSNADLGAIREQLRVGTTVLYGGPYLVTPEDWLDGLDPASQRWIEPRRWSGMVARVCRLREADPDDPSRQRLPNSLLHRIRERLYEGPAATDGYVRQVQGRYPTLKGLLNARESMFWSEDRQEFRDRTGSDSVGQVTTMLDALSLMKLWVSGP